MPKLILTIDGVVVKEAQLTKDRSTIGRRPYNDIVVDHLAVSGEHAVIQVTGEEAVLEDLGSTNGTFVNGRAVRKHTLADGDVIEIGRYKIRYQLGNGAGADSQPVAIGSLDSALVDMPLDEAPTGARVRVLSGASAGSELPLVKSITTVGKRGYAVAEIRRTPNGYELAHGEGALIPSVNGVSVDGGPIGLKNRDQITIGSVRLEYIDP